MWPRNRHACPITRTRALIVTLVVLHATFAVEVPATLDNIQERVRCLARDTVVVDHTKNSLTLKKSGVLVHWNTRDFEDPWTGYRETVHH